VQFSPENKATPSTLTRFGTFELDSTSGELRKRGRKIRLPNQPFQVLRLLVERAGDIVTREELQRMLWPSDTFVDFDIGLNSAIRQVRSALGDSAKNPIFVETVSRRGYRFVATASHPSVSGRVNVWQQVFDAAVTGTSRDPHVALLATHEILQKLKGDERWRFSSERSANCDFREAYLRGRYYWNQRTPEALLRSYYFLSLALDKEHDSPKNNAALADWYISADSEHLLPHHEAIAYAKVAAVRALELEPGLAEVHACLGRIALHECNLLRAHTEFETAARLDPSLVDPILSCALTLSYLVRHEEAREYIDHAKQLDPVTPRTHLVAARTAYIAGDYPAAAEASHEALTLQAHSAEAFYFLGLSQFQLGLMESALENFFSAARENPSHPAPLSAIATVHAHEGRTADVLTIVKQFIEKATRAEVSPYYFVELYLALGDVEKALEYLRRSFDLRLPDIIGIAVDPWLRPLHGYAAFESMMTSLGMRSRPQK
jgi:DNA-binding winged helix-turn-helix (wHTH) protein/tetratricopeptide (TPR) repeat protein